MPKSFIKRIYKPSNFIEHIIENLQRHHQILYFAYDSSSKKHYDTILKLYKQLNETVSTQYNNQLKTIHLHSNPTK